MRRTFATTSIESTLRMRLQGFAFSTNRWIFLSALTSACLFALVDVLSLKIIFGFALAVTSGLVTVPLMECIASFPQKLKELTMVSKATRTYSLGLLEEISCLAETMGVHLKGKDDLKVAPHWVNAGASIDGKIILGRKLVEEFDKEARTGILAHELAHLKAYHPLKNAGVLLLTFMPVIFLVSFLHLPGIVNLILVFSTYGLILPTISWHFENEADTIAASFVGGQSVIKGLEKLADAKNINVGRDTYSHPSVASRISRLHNVA